MSSSICHPEQFILAIDFDGTIVKNRYPDIGPLQAKTQESFQEIQEYCNGDLFVILWTCRSGSELQAAAEYLFRSGIQCNLINQNHPAVITGMNDPRKIYADYYIDDRSNFQSWMKEKDRVKIHYDLWRIRRRRQKEREIYGC